MSRVIRRAALCLIALAVTVQADLAAGDEATAARDLAAALIPPCWQPVYANATAGRTGMMGMARPVLSRPCEAPATLAAARALARRHGENSVPFWRRRAQEAQNFAERGLSLATLVALSDRRAGADALADLLLGTESFTAHTLAVSLIADLHGPAARPLLLRVASEACECLRAQPDEVKRLRVGTALSCAGELLEAFGDEETKAALGRLLARGGANDVAARHLKRAIDGLDARLAEPEAARALWTRDAVELAKAHWFCGDDVSATGGAYRAAGRLADRGVRLGLPFLRFQLASGFSEVAVAAAGNQREAGVIGDLIRVAERRGGGFRSHMALAALGQIGSREAFDALFTLVRPDLEPRIAAPLSVLAMRGDSTTLRALQGLATDPSFSAADRADIAVARDYLAGRLAGTIRVPMMGDGGPRFPAR
jgi:hypothetical protein